MVAAVPVIFTWHAGMSVAQKKKNVVELHKAAEDRGLRHLLEISSKSDREIGRRLSAFHQRVRLDGRTIPLECAYQGSKVFERGGPYTDLFDMEPREAKRDERLKSSGRLIAFEFQSRRYPLTPTTVFYDWLYTNALLPERNWLKRLGKMDGFTDIEFNPERSLNCQARSCALFVALEQRGLLDDAMSSFDRFAEIERSAFALT
jgi:hypothetical protein